MVKNLYWFVYGLLALVGFTTINLVNLARITLRDGQRPLFDLEHKVANGGVIVNHYDGTRAVL